MRRTANAALICSLKADDGRSSPSSTRQSQVRPLWLWANKVTGSGSEPTLNRFASADTIVPDATNPQSFNRYAYTVNNPLKYTDPSGHCFTPITALICIGVAGVLALTGDSEQPPLPEPNYPVNISFASESQPCGLDLSACFAYEGHPDYQQVVYLKDFQGFDEANPISQEEFSGLLNAVAEDLYSHDLTSPGYLAGRGAYDTPFYNGGGRTSSKPEGYWPADQNVCIENIGCSGRTEINYFAQGMWSAAAGEDFSVAEAITYSWKAQYGEVPSEDTLFWLEYGYNYYQNWLEQQDVN